MIYPELGSRLERYISSDNFWTETQLAAFYAACELAAVEPSKRQAHSWKHQNGAAFAAWRDTPKSRRRELIRRVVES